MRGGWFDTLGRPVSQERKQAALDLLGREGYDSGEASMVLSVVCREIEHDEPARAQKYLRSWIGNNETMVMRTLASLCSTHGLVHDTIIDLNRIIEQQE